jgi:predicted nucleotidyltransferase
MQVHNTVRIIVRKVTYLGVFGSAAGSFGSIFSDIDYLPYHSDVLAKPVVRLVDYFDSTPNKGGHRYDPKLSGP